MIIYGAGLSGLIAAQFFQDARIIEQRNELKFYHKALLRFRTPDVGNAMGIDFKQVTVHKAIYANYQFVHQPTPYLCNLYSKKVIGKIHDRSIWNLEPVIRYIAPENFIEQLIDRNFNRITWGCRLTKKEFAADKNKPAISTLPMTEMLNYFCNDDAPVLKFEMIKVVRYRVPNCNVHQTIYFPDADTNLYRASITGDILIAEYMGHQDSYDFCEPFGFPLEECEEIDRTNFNYGKIAPINNAWRKKYIYDLSIQFKIFSLGRFATWRNVLLDDVLHDVQVIRRLINMGHYDRNLQPES